MLKSLKGYSRLRKVAKKLCSEEVADVFLFGSAVKGKIKPGDIDVCIVFRNDVNLETVRRFEEETGAHVSSLAVNDFFRKPHALIRTLLFEGFSLVTQRKFSENFNLESRSLFSYDVSKMKPSDKVRLVYLLKGRAGEKGLVSKFGGRFLSRGCFIVPSSRDAEVVEVMAEWKVRFQRQPLLLIS